MQIEQRLLVIRVILRMVVQLIRLLLVIIQKLVILQLPLQMQQQLVKVEKF